MSDSNPAGRPALTDEERSRLEAIPVRDPDELLKPKRGSIIVLALIVSIVAHLVVVGLTSFSLFADWQTYGVHMPARLDELKEEEAEKKRLAEQQAKLLEMQKKTAGDEAAKAAADPDGDKPATPAGEKKPDEVKPPEGKAEDPLKQFDIKDADLGL